MMGERRITVFICLIPLRCYDGLADRPSYVWSAKALPPLMRIV